MSNDQHPRDGNGWNQWSKYVIQELRRLSDSITKLDDDLNAEKLEMLKSIERLRSEIQLLKFQASLWGSGAGMVVGVIASIIVRSFY